MELRKGELFELSSKRIYSEYAQLMYRIYKDYEFIGISKEEFKKLAYLEIEKSKNEYDANISYTRYLKERIEERLTKYIKHIVKDSDKALALVANYIELNIVGSMSDEYIIYYLTLLDEFFNKFNYLPNPDEIINIININKLQKIIEIYVKNELYNKKRFNTSPYTKGVISLLIDVYCKTFNIDDNALNIYEYDTKNIAMNTDTVRVYIDEIKAIPPLTVKEEERYGYELLNGSSTARTALIEHNLKLVVTVAKCYTDRGVSFADLIQEGNTGLIVAADRFDIRKKYLFSTYATWWIRNRIIAYVNTHSSLIRLPELEREKLNKYTAEFKKLMRELNREPSEKEVAEKMKVTISDVAKIKKAKLEFTSLNSTTNTDKERELSEIISLTRGSLDDKIISIELARDIKRLLNTCNLSKKEKDVLILRFGLNGDVPLTQGATGKILGNVTRERIRQIECCALKKIRESEETDSFAVYMDYPDAALKRLALYRKEYDECELNKYKSIMETDKIDGKVKVRER